VGGASSRTTVAASRLVLPSAASRWADSARVIATGLDFDLIGGDGRRSVRDHQKGGEVPGSARFPLRLRVGTGRRERAGGPARAGAAPMLAYIVFSDYIIY